MVWKRTNKPNESIGFFRSGTPGDRPETWGIPDEVDKFFAHLCGEFFIHFERYDFGSHCDGCVILLVPSLSYPARVGRRVFTCLVHQGTCPVNNFWQLN